MAVRVFAPNRRLKKRLAFALLAGPVVWALGFFFLTAAGCSKKETEAPAQAVEFHGSGFAMSHADPRDGARTAVNDILEYLASDAVDPSMLDDKMNILQARIHDGAVNPIELLAKLNPFRMTLMSGLRGGSLDAGALASQLEAFRDDAMYEAYWRHGDKLKAQLQSRVDAMILAYEQYYALAGSIPENERKQAVARTAAGEYQVTLPEFFEYLKRAGKN